MALPTFKAKTDIPKGFEDEYEEADGEWRPVDHTSKLTKAIAVEREKREAAEALARRHAKDAADADAKAKAASLGMTDEALRKLHQSIETSVREEYIPKIKELEDVRAENRKLKLTDVVKGMFRTAGALPEKLDDFWKLHGDEFDLTTDGKPMVKSEPGKEVAKHVAAIAKGRSEWVKGTRASGGGGGGHRAADQPNGSPSGVTFEDLVKNPAAAVTFANEQ
jgi:hypothetical protein